MSFAIEPIVNPTLDIPAPIVSVPQAGDRATGASSFQDHLNRAGRAKDGPDGSSTSSRTDSDRAADRAAARAADQASDKADRDREADDRIAAERRDNTSSGDKPAADSTAAQSGDSKSKRSDKDAKVDGKKKTKEKGEGDEEAQASDSASAAVVAVGVTNDGAAAKEVTAKADEVVEVAEAKSTETPTPKLDKKQADGLPIDPTSKKKDQGDGGAKDDAQVVGSDEQLAAALKDAQAKDDAAKQDATAVVETTPVAPVVSELHATKIGDQGDKKPKSQVEGDGAGTDAEATTKVLDDTAPTNPVGDAEATKGVRDSASEKGTTKSDAAAGLNADPSFAAQLQGAVEAAATATAVAAPTEVPVGSVTGDTSSAATPAASVSTDAAKSTTTQTGDSTLNAAEALRANSSKESMTKRVAGEESRQGDGLSAADRARLVQRVARAVRTAQDRGGELQIRLSPPELGQLRLQVQMTDGALSARIEAESPQARQVITENLGQLRERLAEQNVRVDRIDVELMNTGNGGSPNLPDRRQDFSHDGPMPRGFATTTRGGSSGDAVAVEASTPSQSVGGNGRLNVVI